MDRISNWFCRGMFRDDRQEREQVSARIAESYDQVTINAFKKSTIR